MRRASALAFTCVTAVVVSAAVDADGHVVLGIEGVPDVPAVAMGPRHPFQSMDELAAMADAMIGERWHLTLVDADECETPIRCADLPAVDEIEAPLPLAA